MKVKLLISRAGANFVQAPGEEIEVSADEAKRLVEAGQAEAIGTPKKETAARKVVTEKATKA